MGKFQGREVTIIMGNVKSLNLPSNVLEDLPKVRTSEKIQQVCQDSKFKILDYLPCLCKIYMLPTTIKLTGILVSGCACIRPSVRQEPCVLGF